jgi:hypothetical protein
MAKYRKKPIEVEAVRWRGNNIDEVRAFVAEDDRWMDGINVIYNVGGPGLGYTPAIGTLDIPTLEGMMTASAGDWIIRGVQGEIYPCKPNIFEATYEMMED